MKLGVDGLYQVQKFTNNDRILSTTFPELAVTVKQVVAASQIQKL
jgi:Uma2 family endonuclease